MSEWVSYAIIAAISFGTLTVLWRLAMKELSPTMVLLYALIVTTIGVAGWLGLTEKFSPPTSQTLLLLILAFGVLGTLANIAVFKSISLAPNPGYVGAVQSTGIIIATLLSLAVFSLKPNIYGLAGVTLVVAGVGLLNLATS